MTIGPGGLQQLERFSVRQRLTMMVNRYDVHAVDAQGRPGPAVAFAEQKRLALREQVTIHAGSGEGVLCRFQARQVFDLGATYDVSDGNGAPIGSFRKNFAASLLRSTFVLEQPGAPEVVGQERSLVIALLRRVQDQLPLPIHFEFTAQGPAQGQPVMSVNRAFSLRDAYDVTVAVPWLDRRLAIAMAIGLDALMGR